MTYIKTSIPYAVGCVEGAGSTEVQKVEIHAGDSGNVSLYNMYTPPCRDGQAATQKRTMIETLRRVPKQKNTLIAGDFNAHHPLGWTGKGR